MSIDAFLDTLTDEQKAALLKALTKNNAVEEINNQPKEEDKINLLHKPKRFNQISEEKNPFVQNKTRGLTREKIEILKPPNMSQHQEQEKRLKKYLSNVMLVVKVLMLIQDLYMENIIGVIGVLVGNNL